MRMDNVLLKTLLFILVLITSSANAVTGPEVAQLLNTRYNNTSATCVGNNPAYYCNGVLVQAIPADHPAEFWKHGATAIALGAEQFAYLRKDVGIRALSQKNGVLFADQFTAISQNKPLDVLCAYPFVAEIQSTRPGYGCGLPAASPALRQAEDPSSCAALGVDDAQGWLTYFQGQNSQPQRQCSLSSRQPTQFKASLEAHQLLGSEWSVKPNELLLKNWDELTPAKIPVQALFYDTTQKGALLGAQRDQRDYFKATGEWLPVLRMALNDETHNVFGFNLQDQLYVGYQVASKLNARFADTSFTCPGNRAAYYCNGVLIRVTDASPDFHAWNPSPGSITRNGVSFSYIRADVGTTLLVSSRTQGLIMKESAAPTGYPLTVRCAYPSNSTTSGRTDSCNGYTGQIEISKPCDEQGVVDVATWVKHFSGINNQAYQCSFKADQPQFALSIEVRAHFPNPTNRNAHNELIIAAWPQDIPERLPLEAFFYQDNEVRATGLQGAQFMQQDYANITQRYLPIIRVNLTATNGQIFTYAPQEQSTGSQSLP